ncbi:MAG: NmrA family NAD(P)-binding protein, partial [Methylococcales bacterium]|nr:NmrA family NAD(P)-binding protein [Methylococcales bacterium]
MILVTGAAGKTGQAIIIALAKKGAAVRGLVRREAQIESVREAGAHEVVVGDINSASMMRQAASGIRAVYHICPNMHPDEIRIGQNMIAAGQSAGVQHFVYHSVLHPQIEAMPHHWHKLHVEECLFESGLPFTILQPTAYMQNLLANWEEIADMGIFATPYPVDARISLVDLQDVS